jgi:predicted RecB family nuclease
VQRAVNATDFYTYYQLEECARRLWLDANRPDLKAPPSEFDQMLFRKGQEHEGAHLATFPDYARPAYSPGDLAGGATATARLLEERKPVIYQGVLLSHDRGLAGIPDLLIREGDTYLVREVKLALNLDRHPEITAQIGLYSQLLEATTDLRPARAEVLMGDGALAAVEITRVDDLVGRLATIKSATSEPDEAVGWSKCNTCGFFDYCWTTAVSAHDPAVVPEITQSLRHTLRSQGVTRYDDLVDMPIQALADLRIPWGEKERRVGDKTAQKVLRQVRVLMSGNLEILSASETPPTGPAVYFDIESNPWDIGMETRVYLWGLLLDRGDGSALQYWGAIAPAGPDGDAAAWHAFLTKSSDLIEEFGDLPFIHYSHYEKTWVNQYVERWREREGIAAKVASLLWDMEKKAIRGCLCLPVHSYGLKHVEKCASFKRSQEDYGSLWSVARYNAYLEAGEDAERKAIENQLLTYNEEDCVAMRHVLQWVSGLA